MKKSQTRGSANARGIARTTLIAFIAINCVLGGFVSVASPNNEDPTVADRFVAGDSSREELDIVSAVPLIDSEPDTKESEVDKTEEQTEEKVEEADTSEVPDCEVEETEVEATSETEAIIHEVVVPETETEDIADDEEEASEEPEYELGMINLESDTSERIHATFNYLIREEGFTPEAAAGVIGNMAVESAYDPRAISDSGYYGLFQWNTSAAGEYWWYDISSWMDKAGYDHSSFEGQVKAMINCSNRGGLTADRFEELKKLQNVEQAAELFAVFYEACVGGGDATRYYRPGSYYQDLSTRKSEAWIAYRMFQTSSMEYTGEKPYIR